MKTIIYKKLLEYKAHFHFKRHLKYLNKLYKMQQNREIDNKNAVYIWGKSAYHSCKRLELLDKIYKLKVKRI